jgi:hypothetical protein
LVAPGNAQRDYHRDIIGHGHVGCLHALESLAAGALIDALQPDVRQCAGAGGA